MHSCELNYLCRILDPVSSGGFRQLVIESVAASRERSIWCGTNPCDPTLGRPLEVHTLKAREMR